MSIINISYFQALFLNCFYMSRAGIIIRLNTLILKGKLIMKEKLYTIPVNDAFDANDECPLCWLKRQGEQDMLDFVLGSSASYMQSNVREQTDRLGFCQEHFTKMFSYGNSLGNAWILKTYIKTTQDALHKEITGTGPAVKMRRPLFGGQAASTESHMRSWLHSFEGSCFICSQLNETYERYLDTIFYLYRHDTAFAEKFSQGSGFCLPHFGDLYAKASEVLSPEEQKDFFAVLFPMEEKNLERIYGDISWFIEKYQYENKDADWKNSKDAIQRAMQKLKGGYPADPPFKASK